MNYDLLFSILTALFISGALVAYLIPGIVRIAVKKELYDVPDERHIHVGRVPRLGGVSFLPAMLVSLFVVFSISLPYISSTLSVGQYLPMREILLASAGALILYLTGLADDLSGVRYMHKFAAQIAAASLMCVSGVWLGNLHGFLGIYEIPAYVGIPLTVLLVMLIVNSINLIDGIDGLASGLCILGLVAYTVLFALLGYFRYSMVGAAAIGSLVAFYGYNVFGRPENHNKIFMGDTGSLFMGYLLAFFAIKVATQDPVRLSDESQSFFIVYSYSILLLPAFDVMRVFITRVKRRRNPFLPDKTHIHHKFLALGLSMRQARWLIFVVSIFFFAMNILLCFGGVNINLIIISDVLVWCIFHAVMTRQIMKRYERPGIVTINTDLINF